MRAFPAALFVFEMLLAFSLFGYLVSSFVGLSASTYSGPRYFPFFIAGGACFPIGRPILVILIVCPCGLCLASQLLVFAHKLTSCSFAVGIFLLNLDQIHLKTLMLGVALKAEGHIFVYLIKCRCLGKKLSPTRPPLPAGFLEYFATRAARTTPSPKCSSTYAVKAEGGVWQDNEKRTSLHL